MHSFSSEVYGNVLGLKVLLDVLASEARALDPAEGRRGVRDHALVQVHHARLESLNHPQHPLYIARVDVGNEAVLGGVGGSYGLFFGADREDWATGPKISSRLRWAPSGTSASTVGS